MSPGFKALLVVGGGWLLFGGGDTNAEGAGPPAPPVLPPAQKNPVMFEKFPDAVLFALDNTIWKGVVLTREQARDGFAAWLRYAIEKRRSPLPPVLKPIVGNIWDAVAGKEPSAEAITLVTAHINTLASNLNVLASMEDLVRFGQFMRYVVDTPVTKIHKSFVDQVTDLSALGYGLLNGETPGGGVDAPDDPDCTLIPRDVDVIVNDIEAYTDQYGLPVTSILVMRDILERYALGKYCAVLPGPAPGDLQDAPDWWGTLGVPPPVVLWLAREMYMALYITPPYSWAQVVEPFAFLKDHVV